MRGARARALRRARRGLVVPPQVPGPVMGPLLSAPTINGRRLPSLEEIRAAGRRIRRAEEARREARRLRRES